VLIIAALAKFVEGPGVLLQQILGFRLLPFRVSQVAAILLPSAEVVVAVAILIGFPWPGAGWLGILVYLGYAVALVTVLIRKFDSDCGCFGRFSNSAISPVLVMRNLVLASMLFPGLVLGRHGLFGTRAGVMVLVAVGAAGLTVSVVQARRETKRWKMANPAVGRTSSS
jgi:hypothetical protein